MEKTPTNGDDLINSFNHTPDSEGNFKGLTKREYFAAMAMQGILAGYQGKPYFMGRVVSDATDLADALITTLNTNHP